VPLATKLFQGTGALAGQHKDWAFNTLLLLYYSQILNLPATYAAIVLAIALMVDALSDPLVGAYSDHFRSRWGRRHPFMFAAILPTSLAMYALFAPPEHLSPTGLATWMLLFTLIVRLAFSFFSVPWNAVAAELSEDYQERTSIITYRMVVGWLGGVLFIFLVYTLLFPSSDKFANGLLDASRYPIFAGVIACLMGLWMTVSCVKTRDQIQYLPQPMARGDQSFGELFRRMGLALQSRNFRLLFFAILITAAVTGTGQVFDVYMNVYFWAFTTEDIRWFSLSVVGAIGSFLTAGLLQTRHEKQKIMVASLLVFTVLAMIKVIFRLLHIWPENGDPALIWIFVAHACLMAYCGSMLLIMFASMMADIVDEQELHTGLRQEGVFSAGITFAAKATTGLGLLMGGLLLDLLIAFPRGAAPSEVSDTTLFWLAITDGIAVPALNFIPVFLLLRYSLTESRLKAIQKQIRERNGDEHAPTEE
jgi:Na+/melibiose symporter-like transporter